MKTKILGLLALGLLVGPMAASAVPSTGTYDLTLSGDTSGSGSFFFDSSTGLVSNISFSIGSITVSNSNLGGFSTDSTRSTCFVEWAITPAAIPCTLSSSLSGIAHLFGGTQVSFGWYRSNLFSLSESSTQYRGTYTASLRAVPEPGTLALLGLGLAGLGLSRRRKAV